MSIFKNETKTVFAAKQLAVGYKINKSENKIIKNEINFKAQKGELIAILGSNGIGKSTFLRTIAGLQNKISGDIFFFGHNFSSFTRKEIARSVSFVSTEVINIPHMLVSELVALGRYPHTNWMGNITKDDETYIKEALQLVGMTDFKDRFITELSDGERQRVMIARTLAQDTQIIILDEPTAYLDLEHKYLLINTLKELSILKNKTIIFSTHDLGIALKTVDKIWLFLKDKLHEGSPEDLILNQNVKDIFYSSEIEFDEEKYDFTLSKNKTKTIKLEGNGRAFLHTKKALERIGFSISKLAPISIKIISHESEITWELNSKQSFKSIYELIEYLKNY